MRYFTNNIEYYYSYRVDFIDQNHYLLIDVFARGGVSIRWKATWILDCKLYLPALNYYSYLLCSWNIPCSRLDIKGLLITQSVLAPCCVGAPLAAEALKRLLSAPDSLSFAIHVVLNNRHSAPRMLSERPDGRFQSNHIKCLVIQCALATQLGYFVLAEINSATKN